MPTWIERAFAGTIDTDLLAGHWDIRSFAATLDYPVNNRMIFQDALANYAATILSDVPAAYYRLNESSGLVAIDSSLNSQNASYSSSGISYNQPGAIASSSETSIGFSSGGEVTSPITLDPTGWPVWSVECWMYLTTAPTNSALFLIAQLSNSSTYAFGYDNSLAVNKWHHLVGVFDGASILFYVDGVLSTSQAITSNPTPATYPFTVNDTFTGNINEAVVYRKALNSTQVATHYAAGIYVQDFENVLNWPQDNGLSATDTLVQTTTYLSIETLAVGDTLLQTDTALSIDANTITDRGEIQAWPVDALTIADTVLVADNVIPVDALTAIDTTLASDSASLVDALVASDSTPLTINVALFIDTLTLTDTVFNTTARLS